MYTVNKKSVSSEHSTILIVLKNVEIVFNNFIRVQGDFNGANGNQAHQTNNQQNSNPQNAQEKKFKGKFVVDKNNPSLSNFKTKIEKEYGKINWSELMSRESSQIKTVKNMNEITEMDNTTLIFLAKNFPGKIIFSVSSNVNYPPAIYDENFNVISREDKDVCDSILLSDDKSKKRIWSCDVGLSVVPSKKQGFPYFYIYISKIAFLRKRDVEGIITTSNKEFEEEFFGDRKTESRKSHEKNKTSFYEEENEENDNNYNVDKHVENDVENDMNFRDFDEEEDSFVEEKHEVKVVESKKKNKSSHINDYEDEKILEEKPKKIKSTKKEKTFDDEEKSDKDNKVKKNRMNLNNFDFDEDDELETKKFKPTKLKSEKLLGVSNEPF
ncbi:MAG: hypothetical protein ACRCX2_01205 [Paraclostridium sp.]